MKCFPMILLLIIGLCFRMNTKLKTQSLLNSWNNIKKEKVLEKLEIHLVLEGVLLIFLMEAGRLLKERSLVRLLEDRRLI